MGILSNAAAVNQARTRVLAAGIKRCTILEARDTTGKARDNGETVWDTFWVSFQLDEDAATTDNDTLKAGAVVEYGINTADSPKEDDKKQDARNRQLARDLIVAALKLPPATPNVVETMLQQGGLNALKGRKVNVQWTVGNTGGQFVRAITAVA